jgi:purine-nucleoside phosphorylase
MNHLVAELDAAVAAWDQRGWPRPQVMLVSGSGLSVDLYPPVAGLPLAELLPFPIHQIEGHPHRCELIEPTPGRFVFYLRGRIHAYQGHTPAEVVFPIRLAALLGAKTLVMSNAAGGIRADLRPGNLVALADHLNLTGLSPLTGQPPAAWGPRFPDMNEAYDHDLRLLVHEHARALGIHLGEGIYGGLAGPAYETPAEIRMMRHLGADLTGMSTVLEVIAARHMGLRCLAFSLVTNLAAGTGPTPLDHNEVMAAGQAAAGEVTRLLKSLLADPGLV